MKLNIGNFSLSINNTPNQTINLNKLTKSTNLLDVQINENRTVVQQNGVAVSKSYIDICKNKNVEKVKRPIGFVSLQYSQKLKSTNTMIAANVTKSLVNIPPIGPIPRGAWCTYCNSIGPQFHEVTCIEPLNESLKITLYGFIVCVLQSRNKKRKYNSDIENLKKLMSEGVRRKIQENGNDYKMSRDDYLILFDQISEQDRMEEVGIERQGGWPLLKIDYNEIIYTVGPKNRKKKSYFSNCVILSFNFKNTNDSVSIRLYKKGLIFLVSCPWVYKEFFRNIIKKLDDTETIQDISTPTRDYVPYEIDISNTMVKSVFSIFNLFPKESSLGINLYSLYNYLWPLDKNGNPITNKRGPKKIFTKEYTYSKEQTEHTYLKGVDKLGNVVYYRYTIDYRLDLNTPKIVMKMITMCYIDRYNTQILQTIQNNSYDF